MPKNISFKEAAALPLAGLTALQAFQTHGKLKEGQKVAVLGGSGGVGSLAVQIAKALGAAHVYATGSAVDLIKGLGADTVINYKEQDVVAAMTGLELDIVFDTVGGYDNWVAGQAALKTGGIYLTIVGDGGSIASIMASMRPFVNPAQSRNTSRVCSPNSGAPTGSRTGVPDKRNEGIIVFSSPSVVCGAMATRLVASAMGEFSASWTELISPAGMP